MPEEPLVPFFIPSLITLLANEERAKGSPLTADEVIAIRNRGVVIALRRSVANEVAEQRGYDDIDPENVWQEWQSVRALLSERQPEA